MLADRIAKASASVDPALRPALEADLWRSSLDSQIVVQALAEMIADGEVIVSLKDGQIIFTSSDYKSN